MKILTFLFSIVLPMAVHSVPQLEWQWFGTPADSSCSYRLVRTTVPEDVATADYSILAVYTWTLSEPCVAGPKTEEQQQIADWEAKMDGLLASSKIGFSMATIAESDQVQYYFYVSDLEAFRALSHQAGEVRVTTELSYQFSRDLHWDEWQRLQSENGAQLYLALYSDEE